MQLLRGRNCSFHVCVSCVLWFFPGFALRHSSYKAAGTLPPLPERWSKMPPTTCSTVKPTCAERGTPEEVAEQGYTVLRSIFPPDEIKALREHYKLITKNDNIESATYYRFMNWMKHPNVAKIIKAKINSTLSLLAERLGMEASYTFGSGTFFETKQKNVSFAEKLRLNKGGETFTWHQDIDPYMTSRSPAIKNYINFWFPIFKEDDSLGNLKVVPLNILKECGPTFFDAVNGHGASFFFDNSISSRGTKGYRSNYADGGGELYDFTLDSIACTPNLQPGDVIIVRGDVPHRTDDTSGGTHRLALSVRAGMSQVVTRMMVENGGCSHAQRMMNVPFPQIISKFDRGAESVDYMQTINEIVTSAETSLKKIQDPGQMNAADDILVGAQAVYDLAKIQTRLEANAARKCLQESTELAFLDKETREELLSNSFAKAMNNFYFHRRTKNDMPHIFHDMMYPLGMDDH